MTKLCKPYINAQPNHIFQRFGVVQPTLSQGVSGSTTHTGVDMAFYNCYGTFLVAPERSVVVKVITPTTYLLDTSEEVLRGYGVMLKSLERDTYFLYWHCLPIFPVSVGDTVEQGQIVGQMGNSGFILSSFTGGLVPVILRNTPPYFGTHVHYEMFTEINGVRKYQDPLLETDWMLSVKLNFVEASKQILQRMINLLSTKVV